MQKNKAKKQSKKNFIYPQTKGSNKGTNIPLRATCSCNTCFLLRAHLHMSDPDSRPLLQSYRSKYSQFVEQEEDEQRSINSFEDEGDCKCDDSLLRSLRVYVCVMLLFFVSGFRTSDTT